jgi:acyl-CoA thioesterase-1
MLRFSLIPTLALLCGCGAPEKPEPKPAAQTAAQPPAQAAPASSQAVDDRRPVIVCFGDSITEGFGLDADQSFPSQLQHDLNLQGWAYRVVNMGVSGYTTQDGVAQLPMALAEKPAIVVVEFGGNDGLRGIPLSIMQANLAQMIEAFQGAKAQVILAGMSLPPNYGPEFIRKFEAMYKDLAQKYKVTLIPFLLEGVGGHDEFMQRDGIHPNAAGARKVEALVMKALKPLLK